MKFEGGINKLDLNIPVKLCVKTHGFTTRTSALCTNIAWWRQLSPGVQDIMAELAVMSHTRRSKGAGITSKWDKWCKLYKYIFKANTGGNVRVTEQSCG